MKRSSVALLLAVLLMGSLPAGVAEPAVVDNEPPLAAAGLDQTVEEGAWVLLDGGGSRDPDGEITRYEWTITAPNGSAVDPECPTCERTEFPATELGVYTVTLTVTDDDGASRSDTLYVTVEEGEPGEGPSVELSGPGALDEDADGSFTATIDEGSAAVEHVVWRIDGREVGRNHSVGSTVTMTTAFSTVGRYDVSVTVEDAEGRTATDTVPVRVRPSLDPGPGDPGDPGGPSDPEEPGGSFEVTIQGQDEVTAGEIGRFTAVTNRSDGSVEYDWSGVDRVYGADAALAPGQADIGTVTISVRATDASGATATATKTVDVVPASPEVVLNGPKTVAKGNKGQYSVQVVSDRPTIASYSWRPSDGSTRADGRIYTRTFDGEVGETRTVTVQVTLPNETITKQRMVRISEFEENRTEEKDHAPRIVGLGSHRVEREYAGETRYAWTFSADVAHSGGEDLTVRWTFSDGTSKVTSHSNVNGSITSSMERLFTYVPEGTANPRPRRKTVIASVQVIDETGDSDQGQNSVNVLEYPEEEGLSVDVRPGTKVEYGTTVVFEITPPQDGSIRFGDGTSTSIGGDPFAPSESIRVTHTYTDAGEYTVEVRAEQGHRTIDIEITAETYTVWKYMMNKSNHEKTKAASEPRGQGWVKKKLARVNWSETGKTRTFEEGAVPSEYRESNAWIYYSQSIDYEEQMVGSKLATESPGAKWVLTQPNVKTERRRVTYRNNGQVMVGWETVTLHRYEKRVTRTTRYITWRYREKEEIYWWERNIPDKKWKVSLTPPKETYEKGTLNKIEYDCSNEKAPKYDKVCS